MYFVHTSINQLECDKQCTTKNFSVRRPSNIQESRLQLQKQKFKHILETLGCATIRETQPARQIRPTRSPDRPPANSYSDGYGFTFLYFFGFQAGNGLPFFRRVSTRPARHLY
jgi:hypothetical protein